MSTVQDLLERAEAFRDLRERRCTTFPDFPISSSRFNDLAVHADLDYD